MSAPVARKWFLGIALLIVALSVALAVSNSLAADDTWVIANLGRFSAVMIGVGPAVPILAGLWLGTRSPIVGRALVLAGAIAFGAVMWWTIVVPVLVLLLAWSTFLTAKGREGAT